MDDPAIDPDDRRTDGGCLTWRQRVDLVLENIDRHLTDGQRTALADDDLYDADGLPV